MRNTLVMLALCAIFAATFADIGPGPEKPAISVYLKQNNTPYAGLSSITFVCTEPIVGNNTELPIGDRTRDLACSGGTCTNEAWFYKFNPCFYGTGYFTFKSPKTGQDVKTEDMNFSKAGDYTVEVDVDTGKKGMSGQTSCTTSAIIALALLSVLGFAARRE